MSVWAPVSATALVSTLGGVVAWPIWGLHRGFVCGFLNIETLVGLLVELESHREHWRRSGRGFYPNGQVGVKLHVRHGDPDRRFAVELGHSGLAQFTGGRRSFIVVDGEGVGCSEGEGEGEGVGGGLRGPDWLRGEYCLRQYLD